jgi:hypothetical protein
VQTCPHCSAVLFPHLDNQPATDTKLSDEAIDLYAKYSAALSTLQSTIHLYPTNGATHRAGPSDSAFSFREANWAQVIVGVDPDPANKDLIKATYRDNYERLAAVK